MNAEPAVSVIVPTYRRRESVRRLLGALREQTAGAEQFEVVVVVDGSEDGTREMVESLDTPYRLRCVWQRNGGRASACNSGIAAAGGELLVLLDDDMEPTREFIAAHMRAHEERERAGIVGAVPIRVADGSPPVTRFVAAKFNDHLRELETGGELRFRSFYSGNFSVSRRLMLEVGGYDDSFRIYGNEDTELSLRLLRAGVSLRYDPAAVAHQHYEKDFAGLAGDNLAKGRTAVLAMAKHPEEFGDFTVDAFREQSGKWARSPRWMAARAGLLRATRWLPFVPRLLIGVVHALERVEPRQLPTYYGFVIDYFFWLGVESALRGVTDGGELAVAGADGTRSAVRGMGRG
jgi:GT2 family glycosyltransferase